MSKSYSKKDVKKEKILIADDVPLNRALLGQMFEGNYEIIEAGDGQDAISQIELYYRDLAILLLDIKMPVLDGFAVMEYMKEKDYLSRIPVVLITGDEDGDAMERGYSLNAMDVIIKPFRASVVKQRVNNVLDLYQHKNHLEELVLEQTEELSKQYERLKEHHIHLLDVLHDVVEYRNMESAQHLDYVQGYTRILANHYAALNPRSRLTSKKIDYIVQAAKWHDIGKIALPDSVLSRKGHLSKWELKIVQEHTKKGGDLIRVMTELEDPEYQKICYNVCMYHHEKFDRTGYPGHLRKDRIPVEAQLVGLADMYEVLKHSYEYENPYQVLVCGKCGELFPKMKECLTDAKEELEAFRL